MDQLRNWFEWKMDDITKKHSDERNEYIKGYYAGQMDLMSMVVNNYMGGVK